MSIMKALVCQKPRELIWHTRRIPEPDENEVLIKVKAVGICGTDIHAWNGKQPFFSYPRVLGHEICGEVVKTGRCARNWTHGQQVAVIPYVACGECIACQSGQTNCCEHISVIGVHQDGGFCEYLSVPQKNVLLAEGISPESAALIEPFAISAHAVRRAAVRPQDDVLVVGAGPIGLGVAAIAKAKGVRVVVVDTSIDRRTHASAQLGLDTLDPAEAGFLNRVREVFCGNLAQTVIDATGNRHSMNRAIDLIRHGGCVVFVGLFKGDLAFADPEFHKKETTIMGSRNATEEDFMAVGKLMHGGQLNAEILLTHRLEFSALDRIYERNVMNNPQLIKGVVIM